MNNRIIAGIVIVIVIIAGVFLVTRNKGGNSEVASNDQAASGASAVSTESMSLKSLMASGSGSRKCTFKTEDNGTTSSGTVYTGDGKMRGDFEYTANGKPTASHMIYDGNMTYYGWSDGTQQGFKMKFDPQEVAAAKNNTQQGAVDPNKNFDFNCSKWSVDNSKFDLPSEINFMELPDLSGAMQGNSQTSQPMDSKELQKQICNSLSGTAKEQCLAGTQ